MTTRVPTSFIVMNHYVLFVCFMIVFTVILYFVKRLHKISMRQKMFSGAAMSPSDVVLHEKRRWAIIHDVGFQSLPLIADSKSFM